MGGGLTFWEPPSCMSSPSQQVGAARKAWSKGETGAPPPHPQLNTCPHTAPLALAKHAPRLREHAPGRSTGTLGLSESLLQFSWGDACCPLRASPALHGGVPARYTSLQTAERRELSGQDRVPSHPEFSRKVSSL